jgi:hypothetical protein
MGCVSLVPHVPLVESGDVVAGGMFFFCDGERVPSATESVTGVLGALP